MIKFNFNANVNIKTNGAPVHRKSLKIFLIVSAVFILICISSMMVFGSLISSLGSMDQDEEYSQHMEDIAALPGLKCTIHTNTTLKAPLSGKEAAFYALRVGTARQSKDPEKFMKLLTTILLQDIRKALRYPWTENYMTSILNYG